ncbi:NADP-dependent oxidoreductase [Microbacterium album]|uniref:NADPH:quinone reductase n=1 Tax=Microbacterium album TaxID=2053191 RepID=A0A917MKN0_9MICO|nr:NADP-dependent oxidoreductase [Microbacterium album]GGH33555.1 NADPH:quinone reductase [Microbacterium album]
MSRAALYDRVGGPEVLRVAEVDDPAPGPGEVAVRVRAAGLNPVDAKLRSGAFPSDSPFPRRPGADLAGTVEDVGPGASYWDGTAIEVGDEVVGRGQGSIAERAVAQASDLVRRPAELPVETAGGLDIAGLTAVSCLATIPIGAGDTVLVGGAAGAVGLIASQLALRTGASVIGTASERNHDFLRSLGVVPLAYGEGLAERLAGHEITAVIDCHGRDALDAGVSIGVPVDGMVAIADHEAVAELGVRNVEREARTAENLARLVDDLAAGSLVLPVAATYSLDEVREAFATLEGSHAPGKVVVLP